MEMIISALVMGIKNIADKAMNAAVDTGLEALKSKILEKAKNNEDVANSLERLEKNPSDARQAALQEDMETLGLSQDEELLAAAKALLEASEEGREKLNSMTQNVKIGDHSTGVVIGGNDNNVSISQGKL